MSSLPNLTSQEKSYIKGLADYFISTFEYAIFIRIQLFYNYRSFEKDFNNLEMINSRLERHKHLLSKKIN